MKKNHEYFSMMPQLYVFMAYISSLVFSPLGPKNDPILHIQVSSKSFKLSNYDT